MTENKVHNYRNFKLKVTADPDISEDQEKGLISNVCYQITSIDVKKTPVISDITILKKDHMFLFIVECRIVNLSKRRGSMIKLFNFISNKLHYEYEVEPIQINEIKSLLLTCCGEKWTLLECPKVIEGATVN